MLFDISIPIKEGMSRIPILPEVSIRTIQSLSKGEPLEIRQLSIATHVGTHMDAPSHVIMGGTAIDEVPLSQCCGSAVVIDVECGAGTEISLEDVLTDNPQIQEKDIVLISTGWSKKIDSPEYHMNPHFSQKLAEYLVNKHVKFVGVDCITVEMPTPMRTVGFNFPIHKMLLGNNVLIVENLADMSAIVGKRGAVWAYPIPIKGADAAHVRVVFSDKHVDRLLDLM